jgi:uroporphyrin-III C-methyltransferase / precorrin-2 dehydrogenase / sirohydrochlorin ferrochelatase
MSAELFPLFLKLEGRHVLMVGAGPVAASKLEPLLRAGAKVTVVAPEVREEMRQPGITIHQRGFEPSDLDDAWLVVAAAPPEINRQVKAAAEPRRLFVNAVDDPPAATAYLGGVVRRHGLILSISTEGKAPALAGLLREALDHLIPADEYEQWFAKAAELRPQWKERQIPMAERRPLLLQALFELYSMQQPVLGS